MPHVHPAHARTTRCERTRRLPSDLATAIQTRRGHSDVLLLSCPKKRSAWVYEDFVHIHDGVICNAIGRLDECVIPRNAKKQVVAANGGDSFLMCPISLSHIYCSDCICVGSPATAFSATHLAKCIIHQRNFRHPITREVMTNQTIFALARILSCGRKRRVAERLLRVLHESRRATRNENHFQTTSIFPYANEPIFSYQNEESIIYEHVASLIMGDINRLTLPSSQPDATRMLAYMHYINQYVQYTKVVAIRGGVSFDCIMKTLERHSSNWVFQFSDTEDSCIPLYVN
jgi:hypothetical protein